MKSENKIKRRIGALVVLGIMLVLAYLPMTTADHSSDYALDADDGTPAHAVYVDSEGEVGIGTETPGAQLDVDPTITTTSDYIGIRSDMTLNVAGTMSNWYGSYIAAPTLTLGSITNKYAFVTESGAGRVGIGDTSPDFKLEVTGSSGSGYFGVTSSSDGDVFKIDSSGNVGIGTASITSKLQIGQDAHSQQWTSNTYPQVLISGVDNENEAMAFKIQDENKNEYFRVSSIKDVSTGKVCVAGKLGVGTTTPFFPLEVKQSANSGSNFEAIVIRDSDSTGTARMYMNSDDRFVIQRGANTNQLVLDNSGNVGIGTANPSKTLTVNGSNNINIKFPDGLNGTSINQNIYGGYTVPSGQTLYLLTAYNSRAGSNYLKIDEDVYFGFVDYGRISFDSPFVVSSGSVISSTYSYLRITGLLINEDVDVINDGLESDYGHTVPTGKTLYVYTAYNIKDGINYFHIDELGESYWKFLSRDCETFDSPLVVPGGSTLYGGDSGEPIRITGVEW
jgi:hypothetical protein